jgi:high-affinity iron transporter
VIINTAVIVFREGLEAVLIIAALTASMKAANQRRQRRAMGQGVGLAFIVSVITGLVAYQILEAFSHYGEKLEAVVSLLAIFILFLITNWFFHSLYWTGWLSIFHRRKHQTKQRETGQILGFVLLGFTSVYREGFEIVLFLQALILEAGWWIVLQGILLGLVAVVVVGYFTFRLQRRLPYKGMLIATGGLIVIVLAIMVGHTLHTMQAVGWMSIHPIFSFQPPYWSGVWLGIFATWETLLGQIFSLVFVLGSYAVAELLRQQKRRQRRLSLRSNPA